MKGTIQTIREDRGFGFIRDAARGTVFFHRSALAHPESFATLEVGMVVEFESASDIKGPRATRLTIVP